MILLLNKLNISDAVTDNNHKIELRPKTLWFYLFLISMAFPLCYRPAVYLKMEIK